MFVEGASPSTHIRSLFPLHPSLSAVDGASIEGEGEHFKGQALSLIRRSLLNWLSLLCHYRITTLKNGA